MTLMRRLTLYAIRRDHGRENGFFRVRVPEVRQYGFGFQFSAGAYVLGVSLHGSQEGKVTE
jgi:hypothetical protein